MKFSIIIPTYNDAESILETIKSILNQSYDNWELIISNDGSTDNTKDIVTELIKDKKLSNKIKYYEYDNGDQLNAIIRVIDKISGDYVYILHSDDLFYDNDVLKKANSFLKNNRKIDAIISDTQVVDNNLNNRYIQKTRVYNCDKNILPLQLLWLGRQLFIDMSFTKTEIFKTKVKESYLLWNIPFWVDIENYKILNVKKVDFIFFKYRVFEDNYVNNEIGKLNVINGELRTSINLMYKYYIPFYKFQYYLFRLFNKFSINYFPIYKNISTKNYYDTTYFIIRKRYSKQECEKYLFLKSILLFFKNIGVNRTIDIGKISDNDFIYYGKDVRRFNKDMINNNLSNIYLFVLNEMQKGFNEILVLNKDLEKIKIVLKFLCIDKYINIVIKEEKQDERKRYDS